MKLIKCIKGEITLGFSTETEDAWGNSFFITSWKILSIQEIDEKMQNFIGEITRFHRCILRLKNGKRLYEYARAGEGVERPVRKSNDL